MGKKTKIISIISLLTITLFLISCTQITCDKPYIKVGNACCLDQNDNNICDGDEKQLKPSAPINDPETGEEQTFTINDLQADIGNVLEETVFLTKDQQLDYAQVYSNKIQGSKFLGTYGQDLFYYKPQTLKPELIIEITDPGYYLTDREKFKDFVSNHKNIFIDTALKSKENFEIAFKEGEIPRLIYVINGEDEYTSERAKYLNHAELTSVLFEDYISFPESVSGNIAELGYIKVNKYQLNVTDTASHNAEKNPKIKYTRELSNINYAQNVVIQCSQNLVISLSVEEYGSSSKTYEKNYDRKDLTKDFFKTPLSSYYTPLITDAQALLKMCEQRYQFTYIRGR